MATNFPTSLDALTNPTSGNTLASPDHAGQHSDANDAIEALQAKVGVNGSAVATSIDNILTTKANIASPTFTGTVGIPMPKFGYSTTATAAGTTTLTASSNYQQFFTGVTTQTITLPVASTMTLGQGFVIHNNSTGALTINTSAATLVVSLIAGATAIVTCILASGTTAASWDVDYEGFTSLTGTGANVLAASPTFTGTPLSTTAAVDTNTTQIATTAYVVGQGYAKLASPTFTGTPTLPTGTIATTQTAADSTTKVATTAFVTTADNLKANLASPTFTGTPTLPTGTIATTQTAGNSTTALATTAFVTTADNLKANLASPALTGTPTAPTASAGTNTTQIATMASRPWNTAWGKVAYAQANAGLTSISTETLRISTPSFTAVTGRQYKITYYEPQVSNSSNSGSFTVSYIKLTNTSGTNYQNSIIQGADLNYTMVTETITTLTAGSTVIIGSLASGSGTGAATSASTNQVWILVEDIGAA
jgi:hypothetical protein